MYACLWSPGWSTDGASSGPDESTGTSLDELATALAGVAPRIAVEERGVIWADARGLDARGLAAALLERLEAEGVTDARAGIATAPVVAECAARVVPPPERITAVPAGEERAFLAPLPLEILEADEGRRLLLEGVGVDTLGALAELDGEAVEVRFGPEGVALWRLARADDARRLFRPIPPERPAASIDFVDYVLTDPARLVFTANALLGTLCQGLGERGEHARRMALTLPLADGKKWRRSIRPARPTASRTIWLRLIRAVLEKITVSDAVAGMLLEVEAAEPAGVQQGDLFDRGFATAGAVEAAVARLTEDQGAILVEPETTEHPLVERRTRWISAAHRAGDGHLSSRAQPAAGLSLQLLEVPRRIAVDGMRRRDHEVPVRLRDRTGWQDVLVAAGPDRISGGQWEASYAREYYRCVTGEGVLLWVYRDGREEAWYLHGWWD